MTGLLRYVYNHNPFYPLSAVLFLWGLHELFQGGGGPAEAAAWSWLQLGLLAGYASLLAATGVLIVRRGGVWDDARTILLTVLLLIVAISVSFDRLVLTNGAAVSQMMLFAWLFSVGLCESVLRLLRLRFPLLLRAPLYLGLALFFLYPVVLLTVLDVVGLADNNLGRAGAKWLIYAFPAVAGLVALSLIPAVRRGPAYLEPNGTPWPWPWYPWPVFVFLAVGVCFRAYYFTL